MNAAVNALSRVLCCTSREDEAKDVQKQLTFMAVGRLSDTATLATFFNHANQETRRTMRDQCVPLFQKLLEAAQQSAAMQPGSTSCIPLSDGKICFLMSARGGVLFCVKAAGNDFPEDLAYQLLHELADNCWH